MEQPAVEVRFQSHARRDIAVHGVSTQSANHFQCIPCRARGVLALPEWQWQWQALRLNRGLCHGALS